MSIDVTKQTAYVALLSKDLVVTKQTAFIGLFPKAERKLRRRMPLIIN